MAEETVKSSGVQELIDRLREEGVAKGHSEAETLLAEARKESMQILDDAKRKADEMLADARRETEQMKKAGTEALRLASRDVLLSVRESFQEEFVAKVRQLVSHTLQDRSFLEKLILEIAGRAVPRDADKPIEILLPDEPATVDDLRRHPESLEEDTLSRFAMGLAGDVVRDGVTFATNRETGTGVCVKLVEDDVQIELTDETLTELLMQHLLPRFQAILNHTV